MIEYKGIKLTLDQDAYIMGTFDEDPYFEAKAHDEQGNEYMVTWYPNQDWLEADEEWQGQNEDAACDWDNPDEVTKL